MLVEQLMMSTQKWFMPFIKLMFHHYLTLADNHF
jgi:hypothetical protein